jgi:hypothetical protein
MPDIGNISWRLREVGYAVVRLPNLLGLGSIVRRASAAYSGDNDEMHAAAQARLVEWAREYDLAGSIVESNFELFAELLGPDLAVDPRVHVRIARPARRSDNVGFHCDTWYGQAPWLLAVHVPLRDLDERACLKFSPGSHKRALATEPAPAQCERGDARHDAGFLYAPKRTTDAAALAALQPVPLKFGEAVVFSSAILHGQEANMSDYPRASVDLRVANGYAAMLDPSRQFRPVATGPVMDMVQVTAA